MTTEDVTTDMKLGKKARQVTPEQLLELMNTNDKGLVTQIGHGQIQTIYWNKDQKVSDREVMMSFLGTLSQFIIDQGFISKSDIVTNLTNNLKDQEQKNT